VSWYQKGKTNLDLLEQETVNGSGIIWAVCKSQGGHTSLKVLEKFFPKFWVNPGRKQHMIAFPVYILHQQWFCWLKTYVSLIF